MSSSEDEDAPHAGEDEPQADLDQPPVLGQGGGGLWETSGADPWNAALFATEGYVGFAQDPTSLAYEASIRRKEGSAPQPLGSFETEKGATTAHDLAQLWILINDGLVPEPRGYYVYRPPSIYEAWRPFLARVTWRQLVEFLRSQGAAAYKARNQGSLVGGFDDPAMLRPTPPPPGAGGAGVAV